MNLEQIDLTASRIVGAITDLGHIGPKHHGIIIGKNTNDDLVYVAEHMHTGYQLVPIEDFNKRYSKNGEIKIEENNGSRKNFDVAQDALNEIYSTTKKKYNLIFNNCESFVNKVTHGHSISSQVVSTIGVLALIGGLWYLTKDKNNEVI